MSQKKNVVARVTKFIGQKGKFLAFGWGKVEANFIFLFGKLF